MRGSLLANSQIMSCLRNMQSTKFSWVWCSTSSRGQKEICWTTEYHHVENSPNQRVIRIPKVRSICHTTNICGPVKDIRFVKFDDDIGLDVKIPNIATNTRMKHCVVVTYRSRDRMQSKNVEDVPAGQHAACGMPHAERSSSASSRCK